MKPHFKLSGPLFLFTTIPHQHSCVLKSSTVEEDLSEMTSGMEWTNWKSLSMRKENTAQGENNDEVDVTLTDDAT